MFVTLILCCVIAGAWEAAAVGFLFGLAALGVFGTLVHVVVTTRSGALTVSATVCALAGAASYGIARASRARARRTRGLDVLARLHANAHELDKLLTSLDAKDRLLAAQGVRVDTSARANVIAGLTLAREDFVRTLRVERVLRENRALPHHVGGSGVELVALEALRLHGEADEYARVVQEAADVAVGVQAAFDELQISDEADDDGCAGRRWLPPRAHDNDDPLIG